MTGVGLEEVGCKEGAGGGCEEEEEGTVVVEVEGEEGEGEVVGGEVEGREGEAEEETATAVSGLEGAGVILAGEEVAAAGALLSFWLCCKAVAGLLGWETGTDEEDEVFGADSFGPGVGVGVGVAVGGATGELPGRLVGVSFKCLPFTMSARLDTPCSPLVGGGGGPVAAVDPPARGGKCAGE